MRNLNSLIRTLLQAIFFLWVKLIALEQFFIRKRLIGQQKKLRRMWNLGDKKPSDFDFQEVSLQETFQKMGKGKHWVYTSGTRNRPKALPYDDKRALQVQKTFLKSMMVLTGHLPGRKTFFAFTSLDDDSSLTARMIDQRSPFHFELLQAPYRFLQTQGGMKLRQRLGDIPARLILLIVAQPRILYSTNPSTLSHFLREVEANWPALQRRFQDLLKDNELKKSLLRLEDGNALERLEALAHAPSFPGFEILLHPVLAYITWDGGYVSPFLDQLKKKLPWAESLPMYSMSTECLETLPHVVGGEISFLPTAKGVLYEFMDQKGELHLAHELKREETYSLVVSDKWGLRRYDTQDLFRVVKIVEGLPDLHFVKRRGMTSSLTGEKLTEDQVLLLKRLASEKFPFLADTSFSLYPVKKNESFGYDLAIIDFPASKMSKSLEVSDFLVSELLKINSELASKVHSGRLLTPSVEFSSAEALAILMGKAHGWESQFKILPLYDKIIEKP